MALAHTIENKVEAAYRRGDLFEKRLAMMQEWADYIDRKLSTRCPQGQRITTLNTAHGQNIREP